MHYLNTPKSPRFASDRWLDEQDEASLYLSVITIGEIGKGILKLRATDPRRSQKLTAWLGEVERSCSDLAHTRVARRSKSTSGTSADEETMAVPTAGLAGFSQWRQRNGGESSDMLNPGEFTY